MAALAYLNALGNPFVYDDHRTVLANLSIRDLGDWRWVLKGEAARPLVNLSYALDHAVWGLAPVGYHLTSLVLHVVNVLLLFGLARAAVTDWHAQRPDRLEPEAPAAIAFVAAALFAVHPVLVEAVGYVSGRSELLCGTFALAAVLALRRVLVGGSWWWVAPGAASLALALGAREVAAGVPLALVAYDRLLGRGDAAARAARWWRLHLPLLAAVAAGGALRLAMRAAAPPPALDVSPWQYFVTQWGVAWRYVGLLAWPASLSLVHPVRPATLPPDGAAWLAAAALLGVAALAWRGRRAAPVEAWGVVWFALCLAPSSSLVPLNEMMAEHRVYLASAGLFLAAATFTGRLGRWLSGRRLRGAPVLVRLALIAVLGLLASLTVARNAVWADSLTLWRDAAAKAPDAWLPHLAVGDALRARGNCAGALAAYREAARLRPQEPLIRINLAACLIATRELDEAERVLREALPLDPAQARTHANLGVVAALRGDAGRARGHFENALRLCRELASRAPATPGVEDCIRRNQERLGRVTAGP
jgi:tetratricopeptide (TPR) repeat protein